MTTSPLSDEEAQALIAQPVLKPKPKLGGLQVTSVRDQDPYFSGILIFGRSKIGKTVLAGSASAVPQMSPVILVDYEDGTLSLRKSYPDVDTVRVHNIDESDAVYESLYHGAKTNAPNRYKTIIIDSIHEMRQMEMRECMADVIANLTPSERAANKRIIEAPSMREFGIVLDRMHEQVKKWRDIPNTHIIFTCLAGEYEDEETRKKEIRPDLQGKASTQIPGRMDEVYYYYMKGQTRLLLTQGTEKVMAGSRDGELPMLIENPTMAQIYPILIKKANEANK